MTPLQPSEPRFPGKCIQRRTPAAQIVVATLVSILAACNGEVPTRPSTSVPLERRYDTGVGSGVQVTAGAPYTCALKADNTVLCWGQIDGTDVASAQLDVVQVSAGSQHACAVKADGTVVCWGRNNEAQATVPAGLTDVTQVSAGLWHTCALKSDGTVVCWVPIYDDDGNLPPDGLTGVTQIHAAIHHTCALINDGTVTCWGSNTYGQTGVPAGLTGVTQISTGGYQSCARKSDGTVACWGSSPYGDTDVPAGLNGVAQVSVGFNYACALKNDGTVLCWGDNQFDQTGVPIGLTDVTQIDAGDRHSCAAKSDATVICWGTNYYNESRVPDELAPAGTIAQSISFTSTPPSPAFVRAIYTLAATGGASGNPVTFKPWSVGVCNVVGNTVTFNDVGTCTIGANQAGALGYHPAPQSFQIFEVVANTSAGTNVSVTAIDVITGSPAPLELTFGEVLADGTTTATASTIGDAGAPPAPSGFQLGNPATVFNITTSATFTGAVNLCINYTGISYANESELKLLHYDNGAWVNITSAGYPNTTTKEICGVTTSFSPFLVAQQQTQSQVVMFTPVPASPAVIGTSAALTAVGGGSGNPVVLSSLTPSVCTMTGASVSYVAIGTCTIAANQAGNSSYLAAPQRTTSITVVWPFTGFIKPIVNPTAVNSAKPGSFVVVKFSLGANRGLAVLGAATPTSVEISCSTHAVAGSPAPTTGSLTYDAKAGTYAYQWKTEKAFGTTCRQLTIVLADATTHTAFFSFK